MPEDRATRGAESAPDALRVRQVTEPDDLQQAARLFDLYRQFYGRPSDQEAALAFLTARAEAGESIILLAEAEGKALGFCQLYPTFSSIRLQRAIILNDLFVDPQCRSRGIARALLDAAEQVAVSRGASSLSLQTQKDNHRARRLYEHCGWKLDDEFLGYSKSARRG